MDASTDGLYLTYSSIVTIATGIMAVILLIDKLASKYNNAYDLVKHQKEQDSKIASIQEEQTIIMKGVLACLKGLSEQGCNGPVHEAMKDIEQYLVDYRK